MLMGSNQRVEESVAKSVPYVNYTHTWHPLHHAIIIRTMEKAMKFMGLETLGREYSLSADGADMFGVWTIEGTSPERNYAMGFRNSMKKSFAFGGCAGNKVLVCDNMCFSGDLTYHRRHTAGMNREQMYMLCQELLQYIVNQCNIFDNWFSNLQQVNIEDSYDKVVLESIRRGVIPMNEFGNFEKAYEEELAVNSSSGTLADFHGGMTRLLRSATLFNVKEKSTRLNTYCDDVIDMVSEGDNYTANFFKNRH